jgi:hypothetical protein
MCSERATLKARCSVRSVCRCGGKSSRFCGICTVCSEGAIEKSARNGSVSEGLLLRDPVRGGVGNGMTGGLGAGALQCQYGSFKAHSRLTSSFPRCPQHLRRPPFAFSESQSRSFCQDIGQRYRGGFDRIGCFGSVQPMLSYIPLCQVTIDQATGTQIWIQRCIRRVYPPRC